MYPPAAQARQVAWPSRQVWRSAAPDFSSARPTTFSELVTRHVANSSRAVSMKTRAADKAAHAVLRAILGHSTPLADIDRPACCRAQEVVRRLPENFAKMRPRHTAEKAAEHADKHGLPTIVARTANTYLGAAGGVGYFVLSALWSPHGPRRGSRNRKPTAP